MTAARRTELRDALIVEHMALARRIAWRALKMLTRAGQSGYSSPIELGDVEGWAMLGLVTAASRYKRSRGVFSNYAQPRIWGSIIDAHKRRAYTEMRHVPLEPLLASGCQFSAPEQRLETSESPEDLIRAEQSGPMAAVWTLPSRHQRVVTMHYLEGRSVSEVGEALGLRSTRVLQLRREALTTLRGNLREAA